WCGLLLNAKSLEVQADYTRYVGAHLATSLTVPLTARPGRQLAQRLAQSLRPKCHPLLINTALNSHHTACLNVYQAFLVSAMKLHGYWSSVTRRARGAGVGRALLRHAAKPQGYRSSASTAAPGAAHRPAGKAARFRVARRSQQSEGREPSAPGQRLILSAIHNAVDYMSRLARSRAAAVVRAHPEQLAGLADRPLPHAVVRWLGITAFERVLSRKQTGFGEVLQPLEAVCRSMPRHRHRQNRLHRSKLLDNSHHNNFHT
ncbi:hypothetical protein QJQ45_016169, partial [Haematococcus lacustris]